MPYYLLAIVFYASDMHLLAFIFLLLGLSEAGDD